LKPVRVAMLGCGTVGTGVLALLADNREAITAKAGRPIEVGPIVVRDLKKERAPIVPRDSLTRRFEDVLAADVVIEVMGGMTPARDWILKALSAGRPVVTANKDVMAEHGVEVAAAARAGGVDVFFEAAVGGGIPIIRSLKESLAGTRVRRIAGILNGTTNYVLTRMAEAGTDLRAAVAEAQAAGFAEADPRADLDGLDAARKLAILASIAFSARVLPSDVAVEGIGGLKAHDIESGQRLGWACKLLAVAEQVGGRISLRVHPAFVEKSHPLASVRDSYNAIYLQGDAIGDAMFYGRGAGSLPTASAVMGDLIEAVRFLGQPARGLQAAEGRPDFLPPGEAVSRFYLRMQALDRPGVLAQVAAVLGRHDVNIHSVMQTPEGERSAELIVRTHPVREASITNALTELGRLEAVAGVRACIRLQPDGL
jgi:homoserine dehydrogenase